jgi:dihydrofolate reductase
VIAIVVAADTQGAIGVKNKIPWRIKSDLIRLSKLTRDHTVILGRKSYDSMVWYYNKSGNRMPGACYIVVTHDPHYKPARENARIAHSVPSAIDLARTLGDDTILVIGGGSIFKEALPFADRIYLTEVQTTIEGDIDAYFPKPSPTEWHEVSREHFNKDERDEYDTELIILEKS